MIERNLSNKELTRAENVQPPHHSLARSLFTLAHTLCTAHDHLSLLSRAPLSIKALKIDENSFK